MEHTIFFLFVIQVKNFCFEDLILIEMIFYNLIIYYFVDIISIFVISIIQSDTSLTENTIFYDSGMNFFAIFELFEWYGSLYIISVLIFFFFDNIMKLFFALFIVNIAYFLTVFLYFFVKTKTVSII